MSLELVVRKLRDAQYYLTEWGKLEVSETNLINRAYREIVEAIAQLERLKGKIPEHRKRGIMERLREAARRLKEAVSELGRGRRNPAEYHIMYSRRLLADVLRDVLRERARILREMLDRLIERLREARYG